MLTFNHNENQRIPEKLNEQCTKNIHCQFIYLVTYPDKNGSV